MYHLHHPLIFFLSFYITGLLLGGSWPEGKWYFFFFLLPVIFFTIRRFSFRFGLALFLIGFGAFWQTHFLLTPSTSSHIVSYFDKKINLKGKVTSSTLLSQRAKLILDDLYLLNDANEKRVKGKVDLTIYRPLNIYRLGQIIEVKGKVKPIQGFGNPGSYDYARLWHAKGIWAKMGVNGENVKVLGYKNPGPGHFFLENTREHIRVFLSQHLFQPRLGVYQTLLLGERQVLLPFIRDNFTFTGTSHLLALSGLHLGMVMAMSVFLFWFLLSRSEYLLLNLEIKKVAVFFAFIPTIFYASLAHFSPATLRSFLMLVLFWWLYFSRCLKSTWVFLAAAAWLLLLFHPPLIYNISFQLSFIALASIVYLVPRFPLISYWLSFKPKYFPQKFMRYSLLSFYTSLAAWLGTMPLILHYFAGTSFVAPIINLLAIPWMGFLCTSTWTPKCVYITSFSLTGHGFS
jgi:competence protein ComEC